ncbi:MAG: response regulator [Bacteroidales bacterium]|jgi:signal transduction histidine kinase/CheY-like chemotaxis protein|nr:response regulator [Bacteroidales bacterium]
MKWKHIIIPAVVCAIGIVLAGIYTHRLRQHQIETRKMLIMSYTKQMARQVDAILSEARIFSFAVKPILNTISQIDNTLNKNTELVTFYEERLNKYPFIRRSAITDQQGNVFSLSRDETGRFLAARYRATASVLLSYENIFMEGNDYVCTFPMFSDETLVGNISIAFDMTMLLNALHLIFFEDSNSWLTAVLSYEDACITFPLESDYRLSNVSEIVALMGQKKDSAFIAGAVSNGSQNLDVISYYQKFDYPGQFLGMIASNNISDILRSTRRFFIVSCILFILFAAIYVFILKYNNYSLRKINKEQDRQLTLFQTILQDISVGLILLQDGKLITVNEFAMDLLSDFIQPSDIGHFARVKFPPEFLVHQEDREMDEWSLFSFMKFGNEIHLLKNRSEVRIGNESFTIIVFSNVTELEKSRKYAVHSELTKSELLSRLSRDLSRSLNRINEAIVLMAQRYPEDKTLKHITEPVAFIADSLKNMQDFGDIESGNVVLNELPFDITETVNEVANVYKPEINRKNLKLTIKISHVSDQKVVGDAMRFKHILEQLLSNAVKFTRSGEIRISVDMVSVEENKGLIRCSVEDTGTGMNVDELKNIFSLETRTKNGKFVGLGTIIAKQLVSIFGGNILVSSPSSISHDPATPGTKVFFTIRCYLDVAPHKNLDFASITSFEQLGVLIITTDAHNVKYRLNEFQRKSIRPDIFLYDKNVTGMLLANKLIIDKNRYQIIIIDTNNEETGFTIAHELNERGLTQQYIFVFIDAYQQPGHYLRAKYLQMDYYVDNREDVFLIDKVLSDKFPSLIRSEESQDVDISKDLRILMCEHNPLSQAVSRLVFTRLGYQVDCVANITEMRSAMKQVAYDIIFIDLSFPPTNAIELTTQLRKEGNRLLIIAITSNVSKENIKGIVNAGMNDYLQKPLNPDAVKQVIHKWFM